MTDDIEEDAKKFRLGMFAAARFEHPPMNSSESQCQAITEGKRCDRQANVYSMFCDVCAPLVYGYEIRQSSIERAGLGLFASNDVEPGSIVDLYCGKCYMKDGPVPDSAYVCDVQDYIVDSQGTQSCIARYINHSHENANCQGVLMTPDEEAGVKYCHMLIITTRAVKKGEELFIDYGSAYGRALQLFSETTSASSSRVALPPERPLGLRN